MFKVHKEVKKNEALVENKIESQIREPFGEITLRENTPRVSTVTKGKEV